MNEIQNIFSIPIWYGEVNNKQKLNNSLLSSSIVKKNYFKSWKYLDSDFTKAECGDKDLAEEWVDCLFNEIMLGVREYIKNITAKGKMYPSSIELSEVWFCNYEKGQYLEPHHHLAFDFSSPFSFIYYLKLPKDYPGKTKFINDGYGKFTNFYSENLNLIQEKVTPDVKEGQYIIFPSFLTHYVTHHTSENERRITVVGDIKIEYNDNL